MLAIRIIKINKAHANLPEQLKFKLSKQITSYEEQITNRIFLHK